ETLRGPLGLTGTKIACGEGHCGACTVQLDGIPVLSCITLVHTVDEREVTTIVGLSDHALHDPVVRGDALQCGFCPPGQIVYAALLRRPYARGSVQRLDRGWEEEAAWALGAIGPGDCGAVTLERGFDGEPVAAVAADSPGRAREALELIDVEWEELEPLLDPE